MEIHPGLPWVKVESTAVEKDSCFEVLSIVTCYGPNRGRSPIVRDWAGDSFVLFQQPHAFGSMYWSNQRSTRKKECGRSLALGHYLSRDILLGVPNAPNLDFGQRPVCTAPTTS
jgi:hypothetical protein